MDWFEQTQKMTQEWLQRQQTFYADAADKVANPTADSVNALLQDNPLLAMFNESAQHLAKQYAQMGSPVKLKTADDYFDDANAAAAATVKELWANNEAFWQLVGQSIRPDQEAEASDAENYFSLLQNVMSPKTWLDGDFSALSFPSLDIGNLPNLDFLQSRQQLTDLPLFAGISNVDRKLAEVSDNWQRLNEKLNAYNGVVMQAWTEAYQDFIQSVQEKIQSDSELSSWKVLVDLWLGVANEKMIAMQRSDHYLAAQKDVLDAGAKYRLSEQTIAEDLCALFHIPTRTEVDELHQRVYSLNKELRALKKSLKPQLEDDVPAKTTVRKSVKKKAPPKKTKTPAKTK